MAAPTDFRVEAQSQTTVILRWTHATGNAVVVYRSTDGSIYAVTGDPVVLGTNEFTDIDLSAETKYWYKASDDLGSTFSSVVTVITHACAGPTEVIDIALPRFSGEVDPDQLNDLAQTVEGALHKDTSAETRVCKGCVSDGALLVDCGCEEMEVEVDQDINSISLLNCDDKNTNITFIIPPNTTRSICGWPKGIGFSGDECFRASISGGSSGSTINASTSRASNQNARSGRSKPGTSTKGTKEGGGGRTEGTVQCVPGANGELTIKSSNKNNSLACSGAKSLDLVACGGRPPYTWSNTGSVVRSRSSGNSVNITPPANTGSGVAGTAYSKRYRTCTGGIFHTLFRLKESYLCNDGLAGGVNPAVQCSTTDNPDGGNLCTRTDTCAAFQPEGPTVCGGDNDPTDCPGCASAPFPCPAQPSTLGATVVDERTAQMITDGCAPCGSSAAGSTVSVTDSLGTVSTIILQA